MLINRKMCKDRGLIAVCQETTARNYRTFIPLGIEYKKQNISERYFDKFQIIRQENE